MRKRNFCGYRNNLLGLALLSCSYAVFGFDVLSKANVGRREALASVASVLSTYLAAPAANANAARAVDRRPQKTENFRAYSIVPDASASLNPGLVSLEVCGSVQAQFTNLPVMCQVEKVPNTYTHRFCPFAQNVSFLKRLAAGENGIGGALWLGEHHNSIKDHVLQADFIEAVFRERQKLSSPPPMAIGLEQVQLQFQPVLDDYISGKISLQEMRKRVDWEKRWFWSFEGYAPIFERAQELGIPLIALNVNSEDLAEVEKAGLAGLSLNRMKQYIKDP